MLDDNDTSRGSAHRIHFPRQVQDGHDIVGVLREVADALGDESIDSDDVLDLSFQRTAAQGGAPQWSAVLMRSAEEESARDPRVPDPELPEVDASEVVAALRTVALPEDWVADGALLLLKCSAAGSAVGWAFRTAEGIEDEEALGVLELRATQVRNLLLDSYGG